jgi:selenocysteine lyase/cysteine desulfurase
VIHPGSKELLFQFARPSRGVYADTASYGLPPQSTVEALEHALDQWKTGAADWIDEWDRLGDECRVLLGDVLSVAPHEIALLPAVSCGVANLAASLGPGDEVLIPTDEFNSLMLPLRVAERQLGVRVRTVPFSALPDAVTERTTVVATSHVRSNDGRVQDLDALSDAARERGALLLVDVTHSAGLLPLAIERRSLDVVVGAAYKHLLCPRGVAFMRVAPEHWGRLQPFAASWRSVASPYATFYGGTFDDLAAGAARFDISLNWHGWVGARESLRLLLQIPEHLREGWTVGLASRLAEELDVPRTGSSILGVSVAPGGAVQSALRAAGIVVSRPLGLVRASFHVYNKSGDVDEIAAVLRPFVDRSSGGDQVPPSREVSSSEATHSASEDESRAMS